jgi:hypothetical protein
MYQSGMDQQLSQVRYNEFLRGAAEARLKRRMEHGAARLQMGRLAVTLAVVVPVMAWAAWGLIGR